MYWVISTILVSTNEITNGDLDATTRNFRHIMNDKNVLKIL